MAPDRIISAFSSNPSIDGACLVKYTSIVRGDVVGVKKKTFLHYLQKTVVSMPTRKTFMPIN